MKNEKLIYDVSFYFKNVLHRMGIDWKKKKYETELE